MTERLPFQVTHAGTPYDEIKTLPVSILLDNVRSIYNVGAFFRTADAVSIERLYLSGITACPPEQGIAKTALGAEGTVPWEYCSDAEKKLCALRDRGHEIAVIETSVHAIDLFDWHPRFPVCIIFGHEVDGVGLSLMKMADMHVRIPMLGLKHSLNVATAGGVILYELLRKYRNLLRIRAL